MLLFHTQLISAFIPWAVPLRYIADYKDKYIPRNISTW